MPVAFTLTSNGEIEMTIYECCRPSVVTDSPEATVSEIARLMDETNVGCIVITDEECRPVGVVTDRDIVIRVVSHGKNPDSTQVGEIMTRKPVVVVEDTGLFEAMQCARETRVRRLPVVDADGRLVGIITLDDIVRLLTEEMRCLNEVILEASPTV
jgi:CBS domain-containing protein